ncbi:3335_t:CDS:2 [Cetraspora pellucida]|uniref:3335_t:CDS:1 n=1 Tax=Cetraspora pellucida TaxID=1433469 RepID=A0ACA9LUS7_9GLOM|nr:3335_t:CDS:2 [Cetraspora pellucida]
MKVGIIGLGVFAAGVAKARAAGVPMDPRVDIAAAIAPEIEEVNKKAEVVDFANAGDGEFRFKIKEKSRVGHIDYRDTRMLLYPYGYQNANNKHKYENLNDYVQPYFDEFIFDHPDKESFIESDKYISSINQEFVVNFKDIQYKEVSYGSTGNIQYQIDYQPGKKVIRKVGEEVPTPDQENKTLKELLALLELTKSEPEINELRDKVINEIKTKRQAQQGKRKRKDEENETTNKKIKIDAKDKDNYDFLKNGILNEVEDNKLKSGLEVAIRMEGEKEYDDEKTRKEIEEDVEELSTEVKQLINGEITNKDKFKIVKEQAVQEIGQKEEAKKSITEKLRKDIKLIKDQIKSFKSGANSYLTSFCNKEKERVEKLENSINTALNQNQTGSEPKAVP